MSCSASVPGMVKDMTPLRMSPTHANVNLQNGI